MMKKNLCNIQALRGVAVLAVMLFHLQGIERKYSADHLLPDIFQLGAAGVDIFFLISGFIMMTVTSSLQPGDRTVRHFLTMRIIRIYPLYWLVSASILTGILVKPDLVSNFPSEKDYLPKAFLLLPQEHLPLLSVGWTLVHEMYFYVVFSLLLLLPAAQRGKWLAAWSTLCLAAYLLLEPTQKEPWRYLVTNPLTLEFTAGCFVAMLLGRKSLPYPGWLVLAGCMLAVASWQYWASGHDDEFPVGGIRVACFLLPCALILAGTVSLERQQKILPGWLQKTGDASYSLYLTHILLLAAGGKIWQHYGTENSLADNSLIDNLLWLPLLFAATLAGGMLCHYWIEKPLLGLLRRKLPQ